METTLYALERLYRMTNIPIRYFDTDGEVSYFNQGFPPEQDPVIQNAALRQDILGKASLNGLPMFETQDNAFLYGAFSDKEQGVVCLGPVALETVDTDAIEAYARQYGLPEDTFVMAHQSIGVFCSTLAMAYFLLTGEKVSETAIISRNQINIEGKEEQNQLLQYVMNNTEQEISRFSYADERMHMERVAQGRPEEILRSTDVTALARVGKQAAKPFKQHEYICCATITLSTRAAISGGVSSAVAYAMSDLYKQKLEKCSTLPQLIQLNQDVMVGFATRVKREKEKNIKANYIEQCKTFIHHHLNTPFTLEDLAEEVSMNSSYLSRRFSQEVGMGIQKYTQIQRLEAAANLLTYSEESIAEIASYLCFSSQSYLGKVFREYHGVTPSQYRKQNKPIDFSP